MERSIIDTDYTTALDASINHDQRGVYQIHRPFIKNKRAKPFGLPISDKNLPFNFKNDLRYEEPCEIVENEISFPSSEVHNVLIQPSSESGHNLKKWIDLSTFISENLSVDFNEAHRVQRDFFVMIDKKTNEPKSVKQKTLMLKSIILAASKIGEALKTEMSK